MVNKLCADLEHKAKLSLSVIEAFKKNFEKLSYNHKKTIIKNWRKFTIDEFVKKDIEAFRKLFFIKKGVELSSPGIGNGEVQILCAIKDSIAGGLTHGDVKIGNEIVEIKELDSSKSFRVGISGVLNLSEFPNEIKNFYFLINKLKDYQFDNKELIDLNLESFDIILNSYFFPFSERIESLTELGVTIIEDLWIGFKSLNKLFNKFNTKEYAEIIIKTSDSTKAYWIDINSTKNIIPNKNWHINIKEEIKNREQNILIIANELYNHRYIKDPMEMIKDLKSIIDKYFEDLDCLLLYNSTMSGKKLNEAGIVTDFLRKNNYKNKLVVGRITAGQYKFQYINKKSNYDFINQQINL